MQLANTATLCGSRSAFTVELSVRGNDYTALCYDIIHDVFVLFTSAGKDPSEDRNGNCRRTGRIPTRQGDKRSNHKSQNTDAQGTRAPTTTLYVLCGLQEGVRLYLP